MDIVHNIENVECQAKSSGDEESSEEQNENAEKSSPVETVKITSVKVDTHNVNYDKPQTLEPWNYNKWLSDLYGLTFSE